ncbi:hypothetical protein [Halobacteroides halobius]|uniref:hypothetical protein n=1 Tax=Halobacteroides halobius TaxID=42422 RepID=UPI0002ED83B2|nr:hypothetical protein [Halobacteroides halobius]
MGVGFFSLVNKGTFIIEGKYITSIIFCALFLDAILFVLFQIYITNIFISLLLNFFISWLVIIVTSRCGYLTIFSISEKSLYDNICKIIEKQNLSYRKEEGKIKLVNYDSKMKLDYFGFQKTAYLYLRFNDEDSKMKKNLTVKIKEVLTKNKFEKYLFAGIVKIIIGIAWGGLFWLIFL